MTYVILGLIATNVISVLVAIVFKQKSDEALKFAKETALQVVHSNSERSRLEDVITTVKLELQEAEADLATCSTPDAVRARLSSLFP